MLSDAQFATIGHLTVGPTTNVCGRVDVGMECETALHADKLVLSLSVPLVDIPTARALTAGVAGIDCNEEDARECSLVGYELAKLIERPTAQSGTLLFPNRYPVVDALQIFQSNATLGAFGFGNDLLRNAVVSISGKSSFFATELFQFPFSAARLFFLQLGAQCAMAIADVIDLASRHFLAIGGSGNGFDSKIDTEKILNNAWIGIWNVARRSKVELAAMVDQVRLSLLRLQEFFLPLSGGVSNLEPSSGRPDAHSVRLEGENTGVVTDGTMFGKMSLGLLVQLVGVGDLGEYTYNYLRAKREQFFRFIVKQFVERELAENLIFPSVFAHPITAGICLLNRIHERLALFGVCIQSNFGCKFQHLNNITEGMREKQVALRTMALCLPALKDGVSRAIIG